MFNHHIDVAIPFRRLHRPQHIRVVGAKIGLDEAPGLKLK